jgi:murein hydrolase activator
MNRLRAFALVALLVPLAGAVPAQEAGNPAREERERELARIRAAISELSSRLDEARRRQAGLRDEVAEVDLELRLQEARLDEAATARDLTARRVAETEREVARLREAAAGTRRDLRRRLSGLYRLGRQGYLRFFLSLESDERLVPSVRLLRYLAWRDRASIERFQQARERLGARSRELLAQREEEDRWIRSEEERRRELMATRRRKASLLARAERERRELAEKASDLADKERKLSSFLDLLYGANPGALAGTPMQEFRGVLDWPAEGKVAVGFGPRLDPRYRTQVPHNGIELAVAPRADVRVVFPGRVLFAAPFQGYGNTVIVHHPGRVFTLYAGLAEPTVTKGDMVSLGDVVGSSSEALYFEIRVENHPDDPLNWLR